MVGGLVKKIYDHLTQMSSQNHRAENEHPLITKSEHTLNNTADTTCIYNKNCQKLLKITLTNYRIFPTMFNKLLQCI